MDKITELVNQYEIDKVDAGCLYNNQELKENLIKKLKEAINYSRCCESDSEQLPDANKHQCNCSNERDRLDCGFECYNK